ncbi:hypothetical protein sscle_01g009700 [Sclerotinia sclerotiorum 1980 UF-70]|uniref:Homeobox domain-containing protein n=1 Tax=Sclerotinia sclerotiorum (strain ATCC 18683 / 1980 / Ss-1) TaxID=665079 RepID=A0A1D9PU57_SCLS1|nr:hypothetical protein sscle_01g009700 [Sclerotinia sclerotiorum 1980 UF-70]
MTLEEMSLSKPNQSESLNSGSSLHEWSQFERHHFLTALPSVDIVSFEGLKPEISERIFELISEGLAKENIMKTPQEDQCLYQQYKANFEDNKYDGRLAEHRWEAIARNLEARGFQRRTRVACASHWAIQEEYVEEEAQRDLDIVLTEAQQDELEVAYKINKHPDNETEAALAEKVELLPHEVKTWFEKKNGRSESVRSTGHSRKRQRQTSPHNDNFHSASPVIASRTNHTTTSFAMNPMATPFTMKPIK